MNRWTRALVLVALAGCSLEGIPPEVSNECSTDADCGRYTCDSERGICVADFEESYDIVLEVTPSSEQASAPPTWRTWAVPVEEAPAWPVQIPAYVEVRGSLRWNGERVPAEIVFSRPTLEGRPAERFRTNTLTEAREIDGELVDFVAKLPAGGDYEVEVKPSANALPDDATRTWLSVLPPRRFSLTLPAADDGDVGPLVLYWPFGFPEGLAESCTREVRSGCTLTGSIVAMVDGQAVAEEGLQVRAVDTAGRAISSAAVTDADGGFTLVTSPDAESYLLRVSASADRTEFPTILVDPAYLTEDLRIRVPTTRTVSYSGRVETASEDPIAGATLTFVSESVVDDGTGITGRFETTVTSDADGQFSATLLAGEYEVIVTPLGSEYTILTEELTIAPAEGVALLQGQLFTLRRSGRLGATLVDFLGRPMPLVAAEASALSAALEAQPASEHNRSQTASSDETGQLTLPRDVGA